MSTYLNTSELLGKTIVSIKGAAGDDEMCLCTDDGKNYRFFHSQGCCESVHIESVVGDLQDLVGEPLLRAEEATSDKHPEGYVGSEYDDSFTWTFYKFATRKGYVDVRWLGESNGWYSEAVDFEEVQP